MRARHWTLFLFVALAGALLDLLTKHLAFAYIQGQEEVRIINGCFSFKLATNPGVIFSFGPNAKWIWMLISILAVPALGAMFAFVKKPRWILTISLGMILAGTLGNMVDRTFTQLHEVRDFIKFFYIGAGGGVHAWPTFNLADSFICVGVFLLTFEMLFFDQKHPPQAAPPAASIRAA